MKNDLINPFSRIYASRLSDKLISDYWVDFPGEGEFLKSIDPTSSGPMFILGGRGSGKTHLMRYMSFATQKMKHANNILDGILQDGYVGLYFRCGAMNSTRFEGKGITEDSWSPVFAFHMELWFAELFLDIFNTAFSALPDFIGKQSQICSEICNLFDEFTEAVPETIAELLACLQRMRKMLNSSVNNIAFTGEPFPRITATANSLTKGIPTIIVKSFECLADFKFLYLIDEFEALSINQQRYINTLIKECEDPITIYVGARLYGVRTYEILGGRDLNKPNADFVPLYLDSILREESNYEDFAIKLCQKRLSAAGYGEIDIQKAFLAILDVDRISKIRNEDKTHLPPHFMKFESQLTEYNINSKKYLDSEIKKIIENLIVKEDAILEKANLILIYRAWKTQQDLISASEAIKLECQNYIDGMRENNSQEKVLKKFRLDLIAQLLLTDYKKPISYCGFKTFVEMSEGLPRNLIVILKNIFNWAVFYGEQPFTSEVAISEHAQENGVKESASWFLREASLLGNNGPKITSGVTRLANLFREIRYSDKPSECSVIAFSFDSTTVESNVLNTIQEAEQFSLLVDILEGQKDKNSRSKDKKMQLSKMLAPHWDLPTARRGTLKLSSEAIEAIFGKDNDEEFNKYKSDRLSEMNVPFGQSKNKPSKRSAAEMNTLFTDKHD